MYAIAAPVNTAQGADRRIPRAGANACRRGADPAAGPAARAVSARKAGGARSIAAGADSPAPGAANPIRDPTVMPALKAGAVAPRVSRLARPQEVATTQRSQDQRDIALMDEGKGPEVRKLVVREQRPAPGLPRTPHHRLPGAFPQGSPLPLETRATRQGGEESTAGDHRG